MPYAIQKECPMRVVWSFLFSMLVASPILAQSDMSAFAKKILRSDAGIDLPYRILLPQPFNPDQDYPLVLFLHGSGERGSDNEKQLVHGAKLFLRDSVRADYPAIIVFPQCPAEEYWCRVEQLDDGQRSFPLYEKPLAPMSALLELLDHLEANYPIEPTQRYLGGLSMGGFGTFALLGRKPNYFAAAFPICGGGNPLLTPQFQGTDFWIFHGAQDDIVSPDQSRNMYAALRQAGVNARYTEYPEANHNSWDSTFAEPGLLPWLFSQYRFLPEGRYRSPVFTQIQRTTMAYAQKEDQQLQLDFYEPVGDPIRDRPLLLYVHGGGFAGGRRDEGRYVQFFERMVERGYTVASITYRLTMQGQSFGCEQAAANKILTFQRAVEDIRSATNFLLQRQKMLRIDSQQLVLIGSSAGAEAVLHAAYWPDRELLPDSPDLPPGFRYGGVVSLAGAMVDTDLITAETAIPTLLYHGTCDNLVPFDKAPHHYCSEQDAGYLMLYGANAIARRLDAIGGNYHLVAGCGGAHEWNDKPLLEHTAELSRLLFKMIISGQPHRMTRIVEQNGPCSFDRAPSCDAIYFRTGQ